MGCSTRRWCDVRTVSLSAARGECVSSCIFATLEYHFLEFWRDERCEVPDKRNLIVCAPGHLTEFFFEFVHPFESAWQDTEEADATENPASTTNFFMPEAVSQSAARGQRLVIKWQAKAGQ